MGYQLLSLTRSILISSLHDDPSLWEFVWTANRILGLDDQSKTYPERADPLVEMYVLRSMQELMDEGWAYPGDDVPVDGAPPSGFGMPVVELVRWNLGVEESVDRIRKEWRELNHPLFSDDVCRFGSTPAGAATGKQLATEST
ncbi:hypothetical protein [Microbacterium sp. P05]|uniref:hypothetical protein n=1 Tax=Microbacterium sp. P05 TaxID=3366948 RepID=UPI003746DAA8